MSAPRVSVVIPTRNGATTLPAVLDALWAQRTSGPIEIVAVDSGSTDGSLEILRRRCHQVLQVPAASFNHGTTRNVGIERAQGEFVILLVQDAVPRSESWITDLIAPLVADASLAGAFARQAPRRDARPLTKWVVERWMDPASPSRIVRVASQDAFDELTPDERLSTCAFDNVASCVRRSVWQEHPFPDVPIAEDIAWAREVLLAGHGLAFVAEAVVEHSHERPALYEYRRTRALHARLYDMFYVQKIPTGPLLIRAMVSAFVAHARRDWRTWASLKRAAALAVAWPLGQYHGARDAVMGRAYRPPANTV